jgi:hypothetical protein
MPVIISCIDLHHIKSNPGLISLIHKKDVMKELNIKNIPAGIYEKAAWLITLMVMFFGYKYIREIIGYVLMKFYGFFIQRGF